MRWWAHETILVAHDAITITRPPALPATNDST
jgi:hypothetical protein